MKDAFKVGDTVTYRKIVGPDEVAAFEGNVVHPVCSTFVLAREMEWTTRQFVLKMRDEDEEGIGTHLSIDHKGPAFVGEEIEFIGKLDEINRHEILCSVEARVGERLIATGRTGQKILKRTKLESLLSRTSA